MDAGNPSRRGCRSIISSGHWPWIGGEGDLYHPLGTGTDGTLGLKAIKDESAWRWCRKCSQPSTPDAQQRGGHRLADYVLPPL
jgi:hypothetical protein